MYESLLSVNKLEEPTTISDHSAMSLLIMRLLIMDRGSMELHPEMGVGLTSTYRYSFVDDLDDLKLDIENQISTYIVKSNDIDVDLQIDSNNLYISIKIKDNIYTFKFDSQNNSIKLSDF